MTRVLKRRQPNFPPPREERYDAAWSLSQAPTDTQRLSPELTEQRIQARHRETLEIAEASPWLIGGPETVANEIAWAKLRISESEERQRYRRERG